jgi:hypothetical protein
MRMAVGHQKCAYAFLEDNFATMTLVCDAMQKKSPTCALCRTALNRNAPVIPNIAVDNTVEKHIEVLASNGGREWQIGGNSIAERNARKE